MDAKQDYTTILEPYEIMATRLSAIFPISKSFEGLSDSNRLRSLPLKKILVTGIISGVCIGAIMYLISPDTSQVDFDYPMSRLGFAFLMGTFTFVSIFFLWVRGGVWWLAAFLTLAYSATGLWVMLDVHKFGKLLRSTRYGGGIETIVEITEAGQNVKFAAYLVLRTSSALLLFDPPSNVIREIPMENVRSIMHPAATLDKIAHRLPSGTFGPEASKRADRRREPRRPPTSP